MPDIKNYGNPEPTLNDRSAGGDGHGITLGYKASAEQFAPRPLVELAVAAERLGLDSVAISDHFQPWRHSTGHAPFAFSWLAAVGERTERITLGTSVLTPTLRYHPSIVAQAIGTLSQLCDGRLFLGVGSGEAMNDIPAMGIEWPKFRERSDRLAESVELMRRLWAEDRVTHEGAYYRTVNATVYDKPVQSVPVYMAASGPKAAHLVGRIGDGFICTSGKKPELYQQLTDAVEAGAAEAGRDPSAIDRLIEIKVSYDHDADYAREACRWWAALALTTEEKSGIDDAIEMERAADAIADRAATRFIVTDDPLEVVQRVEPYVRLGFRNLVFHGPGQDQQRFLEQFCADVAPLMRERWGSGVDSVSGVVEGCA
ncbi:MAG: F420-dependent oxidoreductase, family [Conexibacter sp.]|jgi:coenzyme F420-dependent glucose-6-phosphate dehydrogenase|nr:F420-dependent oxidoreductase, family [Conexibacter sp.]